MITFLWMLYLAVTISYSIWIIQVTIDYTLLTSSIDIDRYKWLYRKLIFVLGLLWSIWYIYFLN